MKTPRPHQSKAIKAVTNGFDSHDRGKLIMACGTGKTLIAGWVRQQMKAGCTLFMAPSNALLAQTLQAWRETAKTPFEALAVCGDASVAQGRDDDDMPAANVGATVTTDYQQIANFISSTGERVVFCTYQSGEALAAAMSLVSVPQFDLAIADEAHRTTGGADHLFPSIVHKDKIRAAKRLFMTATPRFYYDNGVDEIVSMDDEELYGPTFHELDFAEAIKLGLLTDYEILVVGVSPEHEKEAVAFIKKNPYRTVADRRMAARDIAVNFAVLRAVKELGLERVITFHSSCPRAQAAADFLPKLQVCMLEEYRTDKKLWARTVSHKLDIGDRHELLRQFVALNGPGVLTNCRCLGEGVDVPTVDAIAFMDSKKSKIEIAQSVGRAIRLSPGKKKSYVIVPVIMLPGDGQEQVNGKKFKPAMDVINALRAHDSTLMDQVQRWKDSARGSAAGGIGGAVGNGGRNITVSIPPDCDPKIADWFVTRVLNLNVAWEVSYKRIYDRLLNSVKLTAEDRKWVANRRVGDQTASRRRLGKALLKLYDRQYPSVKVGWRKRIGRLSKCLVGKTKLAASEIHWLRQQLGAAAVSRLSPEAKSLLELVREPFLQQYPPPREMVLKKLEIALAEAKRLGYRPKEISGVNGSTDQFLWRTKKRAKTPEMLALLKELRSFPSWKVAKHIPLALGLATALDTFVSKHHFRPRPTKPEWKAAYDWVYRCRKNPEKLYLIRTQSWLSKLLALPVGDVPPKKSKSIPPTN